MPLVNIDVIRGRNPEQLIVLMDTIHEAMVEAFDVPTTDRYQLLNQHEPFEVSALDTSLGIARSVDLVVIGFVSRQRPPEAKTALYRLLAEQLKQQCGLDARDLIVTIVENGAADWSFGNGEAQLVTGAL